MASEERDSHRGSTGAFGTFFMSLLAAWIVAEARSTRAKGTISVSGSAIGADDIHLVYNQNGTSVDVSVS